MDRARIGVIGIVQTMTSRLRLRGETTYLIRQSPTPEKTSERTKKCSMQGSKHPLAMTHRRSGKALKSPRPRQRECGESLRCAGVADQSSYRTFRSCSAGISQLRISATPSSKRCPRARKLPESLDGALQ